MDQRRDAIRVGGMRHTSNMRSITAPTPEQMRASADDGDDRADYTHLRTPNAFRELTTALRAAADQLEAVQAQRDKWADRVAAVELVADMAEDDENGNGWVSVVPLLDALYPEKRGGRG